MRRFTIGAAALLAVSVGTVPANAAPGPALDRLVTVKDVRGHLEALQRIADENGGNRQSGRPGYDASVRYVVDRLKRAGYEPRVHSFPFWKHDRLGPGAFEQVTPERVVYGAGSEFGTYEYSGAGDVTARVSPVDLESGTSACEVEDFEGVPKENIALVNGGGCPFGIKAQSAAKAGVAGLLIYPGAAATPDVPAVYRLKEAAPFPVLGTTYRIGSELAAKAGAGTLTLRLKADVRNTPAPTYNVTADTRWGRDDNVVVVGGHLDSVHDGPGVNDNGSGAAALLATAEKIHKLGEKRIRNRVRFAFFGAEEANGLGAEVYVNGLSAAERSRIALNLNYDMIGSPNYVRFVYDGDNSAGGGMEGPKGSAAIEKVYLDYFAGRGLPTEPTPFDGRSDYGPFIKEGIPAGGLFSGAEKIKTPEQAKVYGGTAGRAYDPCYHSACDTIANIDWTGLDEFTDAAAHATQVFARSTEAVNGRR